MSNKLILTILFYVFGLSFCANPLQECYLNSNESQSWKWKLVWQDGFHDSKSKLADDWLVVNEGVFCSTNGLQQVSCSVAKNAQTKSGNLVLSAKYEKYNQHFYTGSTIMSHKADFSHGRYEIRASMPIGAQIRPSIYTFNSNQSFWPEFGQIDMLSNLQEPKIHREIFLNTKEQFDRDMDLVALGMEADLQKFHLYVLEWNETVVQFFYDEIASVPITFDPAKMGKFHQIVLQIGVGGQLFSPMAPIPDNVENLVWDCPALIVDYIRVYQNVSNSSGLSPCKFTDDTSDTTRDDICTELRSIMAKSDSVSVIYPLIGIFVLLIVLVCFVTYHLVRSEQIRLARQPTVSYSESNLISGIESSSSVRI